MRWPWTRPTQPEPQPSGIPQDAAPYEVPNHPVLLGVFVEPVYFRGEALKHRLVMRFDRGDINLGEAADAEKMEVLRREVRSELGMDTEGGV